MERENYKYSTPQKNSFDKEEGSFVLSDIDKLSSFFDLLAHFDHEDKNSDNKAAVRASGKTCS